MVVFVCLIIFSHSRHDQGKDKKITTVTFVRQSDLVISVNNNKMSPGNEFVENPNDPVLAGVKQRRHTIEVPQMLEFTSTNLMEPGKQITSLDKGLSRYHVTTSQTNDPNILKPGEFHEAKVNHFEKVVDRRFTKQDNQFWNEQNNPPPKPIVQPPARVRKGWAATCYGDENRNFLIQDTSSESCAIPR